MTSSSQADLIWITRTAPYGANSAQTLTRTGLRALALPVLQVGTVDWQRPPEAPDAIVFTSAHGARLHHVYEDWRHLPVYAVGDHTAQVASSRGYLDVSSAGGDLDDLKQLILQRQPRKSTIGTIGAKERAGDLCGFLEHEGYRPENWTVYETRHSTDRQLSVATDLLHRIRAIIAYSPKGAARIAEIIKRFDWTGEVYCISQQCAEQFEPTNGVSINVSDRPNDGALAGLVERRWHGNSAIPRVDAVLPFLDRNAVRALSNHRRARLANDNGADPRRNDTFDEDEPSPAA